MIQRLLAACGIVALSIHADALEPRRIPVENGAAQPALLVNDLKRGVTSGQIGLWIGAGTEGYFRNLQIITR